MGSGNRGARRASRSALAFVLSAVMLINTWPADAIAEAISEAASVKDAQSSAALAGSSEEVGDTTRDEATTGSLCIDVGLVGAPEWALWQGFEVAIVDGGGRLLDVDGHWVLLWMQTTRCRATARHATPRASVTWCPPRSRCCSRACRQGPTP